MAVRFAVDIPSPVIEDEWVNFGYFDTYEEAVKIAQKAFGADKEGRIGLVSAIASMDDDD